MSAVLVVHGLGGTAGSVAPLVDALRAAGHDVAAPTLPGHGTTPHDLAGTGWRAWRTAAAEAVRALPAPTVVVGQSMGAAIVLDLAADPALARRVAGVACINPIVLSDPDAIEFLEQQIRRGVTMTEPAPADLRDPGAVDPGYDRLPLRALVEMASHVGVLRLGEVRQPVLVVTSVHDEVVDPVNSDVVAASVPGPVERVLLRGSGHVATLDRERDLVAAEILGWMARLPQRAAGGQR